MQKKRSIRSRTEHILRNLLFIFICLTGATVNLMLFGRNFNLALSKQNESPIATITFKYKTAQRKFMDRVIWDRLRQESPVYNGDTIRTAPQSEATIWFSDGNVMELYENTMAQVFVNESGTGASLAEGDVTINTASGQSGMSLNSGNSTVQVKAGSSLNAAIASSVGMPSMLRLQMIQGSAAFTADGTSQTVSEGNLVQLDAAGNVDTTPGIVVSEPAPNIRVLNHTNKSVPVQFSWRTVNLDTGYVMFETSSDREFSVIEEQISLSSIDSIVVNMQSGTWYWRVYPITAADATITVIPEITTTGRVQILSAPPPRMIAPSTDYRYAYRTQLPAVRFIWSDNEWATSWQLAVADNAQMANPIIEQRCSLPSSIITSLGSGTWYWQVTPYYSVNNTGFAAPSEVRSFVISQSGILRQPRLLLPENEGYVNTKLAAGIGFSWRNEEEAVSYTLTIADNPLLSNPVLNRVFNENYYISRPQEALLKNGTWYWAVTQTDCEGNVSPPSVVRSFYAVDGEIIHRTVFPPDEYIIADGRSSDIRFTWKSNVPAGVRVQIASDREFNDIRFDEEQPLTVMQGPLLPIGDWYWRIIANTNSESGQPKLHTQPKHFVVVPPLPAPDNIKPADMSRAVIRPATPFAYTWDPVPDADYYQIRIYPAGDSTEPVIEHNFIDGAEMLIDMDSLAEGNYRWTIQAFSSETEFSTRRTGFVAEAVFTLKKLKPISLLSPKNNIEMDGVQAIRKPDYVRWNSVDKPQKATFYLSKNQNPTIDPVMVTENPPELFRLACLRDGTYYWTIKAITTDGLDISAPRSFSFSITPIEPLPAVTLTSPAHKTVYDATYLRESRKVVFTWQPVNGASDYLFRIRKRKGPVVFEDRVRKGTSYTLEDMAVLDRGRFTWEAEAVSRIEGDVILQHGEINTSEFTIDLPKVNKPVFNETGELYGR